MPRSLLVIGAVVLALGGAAAYFGSAVNEPHQVSNAAAKSDFGVFPVKPARAAELDATDAVVPTSAAGNGTAG